MCFWKRNILLNDMEMMLFLLEKLTISHTFNVQKEPGVFLEVSFGPRVIGEATHSQPPLAQEYCMTAKTSGPYKESARTSRSDLWPA